MKDIINENFFDEIQDDEIVASPENDNTEPLEKLTDNYLVFTAQDRNELCVLTHLSASLLNTIDSIIDNMFDADYLEVKLTDKELSVNTDFVGLSNKSWTIRQIIDILDDENHNIPVSERTTKNEQCEHFAFKTVIFNFGAKNITVKQYLNLLASAWKTFISITQVAGIDITAIQDFRVGKYETYKDEKHGFNYYDIKNIATKRISSSSKDDKVLIDDLLLLLDKNDVIWPVYAEDKKRSYLYSLVVPQNKNTQITLYKALINSGMRENLINKLQFNVAKNFETLIITVPEDTKVNFDNVDLNAVKTSFTKNQIKKIKVRVNGTLVVNSLQGLINILLLEQGHQHNKLIIKTRIPVRIKKQLENLYITKLETPQ